MYYIPCATYLTGFWLWHGHRTRPYGIQSLAYSVALNQVQVLQHAAVAGRQDEAIAVAPRRVLVDVTPLCHALYSFFLAGSKILASLHYVLPS